MLEHTPGPWTVFNLQEGTRETIIYLGSEGHPQEAHVEVCGPNREANCALIAAAPETASQRDELLAALEQMVGAYSGDREMSADDCIEACEKAREAIAKTKGGE